MLLRVLCMAPAKCATLIEFFDDKEGVTCRDSAWVSHAYGASCRFIKIHDQLNDLYGDST